jgi:hypothetical protein
MLHVSDFSSNDFVIEISQNPNQKGQNNVIQNEHNGEQDNQISRVVLHILVEHINHILLGENGKCTE